MSKLNFMELNLSKEDLINLVTSQQPGYDLFDNLLVKNGGSYQGSYNDRYVWDLKKLNEYSEQDLFNLYELLKNQWK